MEGNEFAHTPDEKTVSRYPWKIFWIALILRLVYLTAAQTFRFKNYPWMHHFQFGWEMGQIADALATGRGYSDPFSWGQSGPTAWTTPLFPLLLAGVFKLFGPFSLLSGWVIEALNSLFNSLVVCTIWELASRCCNRRVALWSAWIWALYPAAMQYCVRWVWEMSLTLLLFQLSLVVAFRMRRIGEDPTGMTTRRWALFGFLWGLIALSNASLLLFLPFCGLWILAGAIKPTKAIAGAALAAAIFGGVIAPWSWRNWKTFHQFIPLRSNFGAELYLGNIPDQGGLLAEYDHPNQALDQFRIYKQMGEVAYSKMRGEDAKAMIRENPKRFVVNTLRRIFFFWAGTPQADVGILTQLGRGLNFGFGSIVGFLGLLLAIKRRLPAAWLFAGAFLLLPLVYYGVTVGARFRHPLEPIIVILGVYLFQAAERKSKTQQQIL